MAATVSRIGSMLLFGLWLPGVAHGASPGRADGRVCAWHSPALRRTDDSARRGPLTFEDGADWDDAHLTRIVADGLVDLSRVCGERPFFGSLVIYRLHRDQKGYATIIVVREQSRGGRRRTPKLVQMEQACRRELAAAAPPGTVRSYAEFEFFGLVMPNRQVNPVTFVVELLKLFRLANELGSEFL